jgi:hypothetical protein
MPIDMTPVSKLGIDTLAENLAAIKAAQAEGEVFTLDALDLDHFSPAPSTTGGLRPASEGDPGTTRKVIIVHNHATRQLYLTKYDANTPAPPDCASWDGKYGTGDPGGECAKCPYNRREKEDPADESTRTCHEYHMIYGLTVEGTLPIRFSIPRTSLRSVRKFMGRAPFEYGKMLTDFVTVIGVENLGPNKNVITLTKGADLTPDAAAKVREYAPGFRAILSFPTQAGMAQKLLEDPTAKPVQVTQGSSKIVSDGVHEDTGEGDDTEDDLPL